MLDRVENNHRTYSPSDWAEASSFLVIATVHFAVLDINVKNDHYWILAFTTFAAFPCPCGGDVPTCCCVWHQWQSQKWSLNITHSWCSLCGYFRHWLGHRMLCWILVKSEMIMEHLLTPGAPWPGGGGTTLAFWSCVGGCCTWRFWLWFVGYQRQSQKWSLLNTGIYHVCCISLSLRWRSSHMLLCLTSVTKSKMIIKHYSLLVLLVWVFSAVAAAP